MLVRFSVENAFSFRDEAILNMLASADARHDARIARGDDGNGVGVLRTAGIYGANGHGKTKLVEAIQFCKQFASGNPEAIEEFFQAFKLGDQNDERPARFVMEFRISDRHYEYGLLVRDYAVYQEWLIEIKGKKEQALFTREIEQDHQLGGQREYKYTFGSALTGSKIPESKFRTKDYLEFLAKQVPDDRSFLFEASDRKVVFLDDAARWFFEVLQPVGAETSYVSLQTKAARDTDFLSFLNDRMARSDTGIERLAVRRTHMSDDMLAVMLSQAPPQLSEAIENLEQGDIIPLGSNSGDMIVIERDADSRLMLLAMGAYRHAADGREVAFSLDEESSGTQRLLDLYPMLFSLVNSDRVYVVDELDRKLHPLLAYDFISQFLTAGRGQLIFTTHTTYLLDLDLLRRDEIWFVQKTEGSSTLYSLASFKIRPDLDIRKGYLNGRFGAIPFAGDPRALGWLDPQNGN